MKTIKYFIEYYIILFFILLFKFLPTKFASLIVENVLKLFFGVYPIRKKIVTINYKYVFNREPSKEFFKKFYNNLAITFTEILLLFAKDFNYLKEKYRKNLEKDDIKKEILASKNPILITMHFSNWEMTGAFISFFIKPIYPAFKKQSNRKVENLLNKIRKKYNMNPVYSERIVKETILNKNEIFAFLIDQNLRQGKFYKFLGKDTLLTDVPIKLALKQQRDIIYGAAIRDKENLLEFKKIKFANEEINIYNIMNTILDDFSNLIYNYPHLWFGWLHKLWKITSNRENIYEKVY